MYSREKEQLKNGFDALAPDLFENIREKEFVKVETEEELFLGSSSGNAKVLKMKRRKTLVSSMVAVAACFLCLLLFGKQENVENRIILDINPSISIWLDKENQVTKVEALNEDGKEILDKFPEVKNLDETVTEILQRLTEKNYLQQDKASVLVTYDYKSGVAPKEQVEKIVDGYLETENEQVTVIYQEIEAKEEEEKRAKERGVSVGKYHFIKKLEKDHELNADELYDKNMEEIVKNANDKGVDVKKEATAGREKAEKQEKKEVTESEEEISLEAGVEKPSEEIVETPKPEEPQEKDNDVKNDTSGKNNRKKSPNKSRTDKNTENDVENREENEVEGEEESIDDSEGVTILPEQNMGKGNMFGNSKKQQREEERKRRNGNDSAMNKYSLEKFPLK